MNTDQVLKRLWKMVEDAGSQKKLANELGVSQQYLSDVLTGRKEPGEGILRGLGLKRVLDYVPRD